MKIQRLGFEKVFYQIDQLYDFYKKEDNYPVHITVGLTSFCNHKCVFCYGDYETSDPRKNISIDADRLLEILKEMHECGLKSISLVGTGEPLIYKDFIKIIQGIKKIGLDLAIYTNGARLQEDIQDAVLECCTWFRISCNAADTEMHNKVHQVKDEFEMIVENVQKAVEKRNALKKKFPTVGVQFVGYEENYHQIYDAAKLWKEAGVDYFAIKPMYKQEKNKYIPPMLEDYDKAEKLMTRALELEDEKFKVYAKFEQFKEVIEQDPKREYGKCYGHAFSTALLADGNFYLCGNLHSEERYSFGSIYDRGFKDIWYSEKRKKVIKNINFAKCPVRCRCHPLNLILWDLKHPDPNIHPNFL